MARYTRPGVGHLAAVITGVVLASLPSILPLTRPWTVVLVLTGAALSVGGAWLQYRAAAPFVLLFGPDDWTIEGSEVRLVVSARRHGKGGHPSVSTWLRDANGTLEEVSVDVREGGSPGDVLLAAASSLRSQMIGEVHVT
jgi:hypothetical protein